MTLPLAVPPFPPAPTLPPLPLAAKPPWPDPPLAAFSAMFELVTLISPLL
jgi:hypothetical protein